MKKILAIALLGMWGLGLQPAPPHHANFSGTWVMNIKKSKNLPPSFKNVKSYKMRVEDAGDSMTVFIQFEGMGQKVDIPPTVYSFDGIERYREDTARGSKRWATTTWTTNGLKLIVNSRVIQSRGSVRQYKETDVWLLRGAKRLDIEVTQKFEGSDSTNSEQRIFSRAAN